MRNLIAFGTALLLVTSAVAQPTSEAESPKTQPGQVEIRFRDDSRLKVLLKEEKLDFDTRYGRLTIPLAEIQSLELGSRVPPELIARVDAAIKKLGSGDFKDREAAAAELVSLGVKALPAVITARNSADAEVVNRAQQIADKIMESASAEELEQKAVDVLTTAESKITGRVVAPSLKLETPHFGTQTVKLADALSIRSLSALDNEGDDRKAEPDPGNLMNYRDKVGKVFSFRVTGGMNGFVWGSDTYTSDSSLATAAVHAGVLKLGQTGIVRVKMVPPPVSFESSARNGIISHAWSGHPGAYQIIKRGLMR
jgi:hypothetical protein